MIYTVPFRDELRELDIYVVEGDEVVTLFGDTYKIEILAINYYNRNS